MHWCTSNEWPCQWQQAYRLLSGEQGGPPLQLWLFLPRRDQSSLIFWQPALLLFALVHSCCILCHDIGIMKQWMTCIFGGWKMSNLQATNVFGVFSMSDGRPSWADIIYFKQFWEASRCTERLQLHLCWRTQHWRSQHKKATLNNWRRQRRGSIGNLLRMKWGKMWSQCGMRMVVTKSMLLQSVEWSPISWVVPWSLSVQCCALIHFAMHPLRIPCTTQHRTIFGQIFTTKTSNRCLQMYNHEQMGITAN